MISINRTITKIFVSLLIVFMAFPLFASSEVMGYDNVDKSLITANPLDFEDVDTQMDYWFLASYNLMLQNKGLGGILAFEPKSNEYIAGYKMQSTPDDFFIDVPASTLMSPMMVPVMIARAIFMSLGDADSISRITHLEDDAPLLMVSVLKLYDNEEIVLEDAAFSLARQALEASFGASGLNIEPVYAVYERNGKTQNDLVEIVLSGEKTPNELSLEAIRLMKAEANSAPQYTRYILYVSFAAALLMLLAVVLLLVIKARQKTK